jgi:hypothetical protein
MKHGDCFAGMRVLLSPRLHSCPFKVVCLFCLSCWDLPNHSTTCRQASSKRSPEYYLTQKVDPRRKEKHTLAMTTWSGFVTVNHPSELHSEFYTSETSVQLNKHSKYCHSHSIIAILKTVLITFLFWGWENWSSLMIWTSCVLREPRSSTPITLPGSLFVSHVLLHKLRTKIDTGKFSHW